jgi:hypothetical protein
MAAADRVTGIQGGANVNFSQAQLLAGANAIASNTVGTYLYIRGGNGNGTGQGGAVYIYSGDGGVTGASGELTLQGGKSGATSGAVAPLRIIGGLGNSAGTIGGRVDISTGVGGAGAACGDLLITLKPGAIAGHMTIDSLPTSDPSSPGTLYVDPVTHIVHWK